MSTVALLGNSGLLLKSALKLGEVRPGFDPKGVVLTALDPPPGDMLGTDYDLKSDTRQVLPSPARIARRDTRVARRQRRRNHGRATVRRRQNPRVGARSGTTGQATGSLDPCESRRFSGAGIQFRQGSDFASTEVENQNNSAPVIVDQTYRERYLAHKIYRRIGTVRPRQYRTTRRPRHRRGAADAATVACGRSLSADHLYAKSSAVAEHLAGHAIEPRSGSARAGRCKTGPCARTRLEHPREPPAATPD